MKKNDLKNLGGKKRTLDLISLRDFFKSLNNNADDVVEEIEGKIGRVSEIPKNFDTLKGEILDIFKKLSDADTELRRSLNLSDDQYKILLKSVDSLETIISKGILDIQEHNKSFEGLPSIIESEVSKVRSYVATEVKKIDDLKIASELKKVFLLIAEVEKFAKSIPWGGASYFQIVANNGQTIYQAPVLNFKNGNNTSVVVSQNNQTGNVDVSINANGGFTELPASGTVNSVNTVFTFTQKPSYIVSDGVWYKVNNGWTWNPLTLTATLTIPPNNLIFGVA